MITSRRHFGRLIGSFCIYSLALGSPMGAQWGPMEGPWGPPGGPVGPYGDPGGPMGLPGEPQGAPWAPQGPKPRFSLGFSSVRAQNLDFPEVF